MSEDIREYLEPVFIRARNLPEAWYLLLKKLFEIDAYTYFPEWGGGADEHGRCDNSRREFDFAVCQITHPWERPLCDILPPGLGIPAPPTTMDKIEEYFATYILNPYKAENESYTYGERICEQVDDLIRYYRTYGFDHVKGCIEIASPSDLARGKSLPCLRLIDTKIRMDRKAGVYRMHFYVYFRAWDLWGGFPVNMGGLQLFKEWLVEQIGPHPKTGIPLEDGEMIVMSKSLNVRGHMEPYARARVGL
ncbi:thymidylate synthase [Desulfofundulus luciae]|uniref:Thymidylate synthase n=1 Tax=Desulfofundulus luciae TaxID=74702 RepID=A0ABU0AZI8_9FIRM|nr:hypothetical protein [Desulfofundulus luciae]MDQ0285472.1 thymidylate synthase [Desulfofundulus luciae]